MGRRKIRRRQRLPVQAKRELLVQRSRNQGNRSADHVRGNSVPKPGDPLNATTIMQLQQAVGNHQTGQIIKRYVSEMGAIQRGPSKELGYRRDKPPQPWGQFTRPQAQHRRRQQRRQRRRPPPPPPKKTEPLHSAAPQVMPASPGKTIIMSPSEFQSKTTLKILGRTSFLGFRRPGRSGDKFAEWVTELKKFHGPIQSKDIEDKAHFLRNLAEDLVMWLRGKDGLKSSRRNAALELMTQVISEVDRLYLEQAKIGWQQYQGMRSAPPLTKAAFLQNVLYKNKGRSTFTDDSTLAFRHLVDLSTYKMRVEALENKIDDAIDNNLWQASPEREWFTGKDEETTESEQAGGQLNKLDIITYKFKLSKHRDKFRRTKLGKDKPSAFKGYFKKKSYVDKDWAFHKGRHAHMPTRTPGHHRRTLAMYKLDKLLDSDVIPPTFIAKHKDKIGTIMQEVKGKRSTAPELRSDPKVMETERRLYLLDVVAGQVDRHNGNLLVQMDGGKVVGVKGFDLDLAFGPGYLGETLEEWSKKLKKADLITESQLKQDIHSEIAGKLPFEIGDVSQEFAKRVIKLSKSGEHLVRDALKGYLAEEEIDATLGRLKTLAKFMKPIAETEKGLVLAKKQ